MKPISLFTLPGALLLSALLVFPTNAHAQNAGGSLAPRAENYLLGPGDVLGLTVAGFPELGQEVITVPPDGVVYLARLGPIRMTGRTKAQVQNDIRQKLIEKIRLRNPQVALDLKQVRSGIVGNVSISGDVPRTGSSPLREGERLSDLLADMGLSERLEERRAILSRGSQRLTLDLNTAASRPGSSADIILRAGDSIAVQSIAPGRITIQGDVERPGIYELHSRPKNDGLELGLAPRLSDLIIKAGGLKTLDAIPGGGTTTMAPTNGTAGFNGASPASGVPGGNPFATGGGNPFAVGGGNKSPLAVTSPLPSPAQGGALLSGPRMPTTYKATLQRASVSIPLNVEAAMNGVASKDNVYLKADDVIYINLVRPMTVLVEGAISKVGPVQLAPGAGVLELLAIAGPLTRTEATLQASVRRGTKTIPLDLPAVMHSTNPNANIPLQEGDIVQLREPETMTVNVAGQVARNGSVRLRPGMTAYDAVQAAGGQVPGTPLQNARLTVLRRQDDGSQRTYELNAFGILNLLDVSTNLVLREGDIVTLTGPQERTVFVSGEVVAPNSVSILPGEGLAQAITRAGGAKDSAALTRVTVTRRGGAPQVVDIYDTIKNGKPLNFALQSGDIVNVPVNPNQISANEAFAKPGYYTIPEHGQLTLLDLITVAQPVSGVKNLYIFHADATGKVDISSPEKRRVVLQDVRRGRQQNFALAPRDVIFAEPPTNKQGLLAKLAPLSIFSFLIR